MSSPDSLPGGEEVASFYAESSVRIADKLAESPDELLGEFRSSLWVAFDMVAEKPVAGGATLDELQQKIIEQFGEEAWTNYLTISVRQP